MFLEISQNSQENIGARVFLLIKLQATGLHDFFLGYDFGVLIRILLTVFVYNPSEQRYQRSAFWKKRNANDYEIIEAVNKIPVKYNNRGFYSRKSSSPLWKLDNCLSYANSIIWKRNMVISLLIFNILKMGNSYRNGKWNTPLDTRPKKDVY